MTGRIETYIHSDTMTPNKGASLVRVITQTDFAAKTELFISFCGLVARYAYAAQAEDWNGVISVFPDMEVMKNSIQEKLHETIVVDEIRLLTL